MGGFPGTRLTNASPSSPKLKSADKIFGENVVKTFLRWAFILSALLLLAAPLHTRLASAGTDGETVPGLLSAAIQSRSPGFVAFQDLRP